MAFQRIVPAIVAILALCAPTRAGAQRLAPGMGGPPPPSPFETGMHGFGMGVTVGAAAGYLVARDDGLDRRDWRVVAMGTGIGALAGGAMGLALGIMERSSSGAAGRGYLVMREMGHGSRFGLVGGAIVGGLTALDDDDYELILFGGALGTLIGAAVGVLVGSVERNPWAQSDLAAPPPGAIARSGAWTLTATPLVGPTRLSWGPGLVGRF
jgi:hypothetical protein